MKWKFGLVDNWKEAKGWFSIHCFTVIGAINGAWFSIPSDMKAYIPPKYLALCSGILAALGIIARLTRQDVKPSLDQDTLNAEGVGMNQPQINVVPQVPVSGPAPQAPEAPTASVIVPPTQ